MDKTQFILLIIQVLILIIQCTSDIREKRRIRAAQKGYFKIAYRNNSLNDFSEGETQSSAPAWIYDFEKPIKFKNIGDDAVSLLRTEIHIENRIDISKNIGTIFSNGKDFSVVLLFLGLNQEEKEKDELNIDFHFYLKNSSGYKYQQIVKSSFTKEDYGWRLKAYGWEFKRYRRIMIFPNNKKIR